MKRYITFISCFIVLCGLLGCTDERWLENGSAAENAGGLPIEFVMDLAPIQPVTRTDGTTINYGQKTEFVKDDIIQIVANFYKKSETDNDEFELMQGKSVCCILTYNGEKWEDKSGANLYWPWDSEKADFTAFYYPGFDGVLSVGPSPTVLLDSLKATTDPLMTNKISDIPYGNAVPLKFEHKCARLILTDLDAVTGGASYSELWMENLNSETDKTNTNAFLLNLSNTDNKLSLDFNFKDVRDENNRVLIGGKTAVDENNNSVKNSMLFFLPPGNYSKVALTRRFGHSLFRWDSVDDLNKLEADSSYIVSLKDLLGHITIDNDDWWEDEDKYIKPENEKFNLNDFLECVGNGRPYSYYDNGNEVVVLERIANNYVVLKKNIDFNSQKFTLRNIDTDITFDANGHFFKNVTYNSIFNKIDGNVMNLGIIDSKVTNISLTEEEVGAQGDYKANMFGLLARECLGNIDRIRLSNITINVSSLEEGGTFMVGALVGENNLSPITNIEVNGNITVTANDELINGSMILGGLVGQNGKDASLESITVYDNAKISVTNSTQIEKGSVYTGGLVGLSSSDVKNCKVLADVDASQANGIWVYTGGVVGSLRNSTDSDNSETLDTAEETSIHIKLENSQNIGTVIGGRCLQNVTENGTASGHSSTGGLVGYSLRADITNSLVSGTVSSTINVEDGKSEYYTIGGVVGAVRAVKSGDVHDYPVVRDNSIYANVESLPNETSCFVGWLAGIAPKNIIDQINLNSLYVVTELGKVGRIDDSAPGK